MLIQTLALIMYYCSETVEEETIEDSIFNNNCYY